MKQLFFLCFLCFLFLPSPAQQFPPEDALAVMPDFLVTDASKILNGEVQLQWSFDEGETWKNDHDFLVPVVVPANYLETLSQENWYKLDDFRFVPSATDWGILVEYYDEDKKWYSITYYRFVFRVVPPEGFTRG